MNCLRADEAEAAGEAGRRKLEISGPLHAMPVAAEAGTGAGTGMPLVSGLGTATEAMGRHTRSWSSSHVDSVGESTHSKNSLEGNETWRRLRLQQIFYKSILQNDLDMVVRCLHHGADMREEYHPHCHTVLHVSSCRGYLKMTELLLRAGSNPNTLDEKAFLPLHYAAQEGHFHTVRCLLHYGSMVTVENEYGDAPIHTAVRYGHADLLPLILAVDPKRDFGGTAAVPEKIARTEHLNLQNANGDTGLHIAAALDKKNIVKKLLQWGADTGIQDRQGMTPLQIAVDRNFLAVAKLLRQAPTVYHHQTQAQALSSLGAYPFKDSDGLERYTEEITRQRMEEEAALIAQQQQQQQQPLYDIYNSSQIFLPPQPPSQQQPQPVAASPLTRSQSHTRLPMKQQVRRESSLEVLPQMTTKTVELDPQPNNVNADLATGQRVSRLQRAATEFDFRRSHRAPAPLPVAVAEPVLTANGVDLNRATAMPTASSKSVGERMDKLVKVKKEVEEKRYSEKVDRRMDALSLEMTDTKHRESDKGKKKSHQQQSKPSPHRSSKPPPHQNGSVANKENKPSATISVKESKKESKKKSSNALGRPKTTTKIKITYGGGDSGVGDSSGSGSRPRSAVTTTSTASTSPPPPMSPPPPPMMMDNRNGKMTIMNAASMDRPSVLTSANRSMEETWYQPGGGRVVMVRDVAVDSSSLNGHLGDQYSDLGIGDEFDNCDDLPSIRLTEYRNGKKVIREAPTIKDYYASRIGRVSPKIRDLQDQLRRSQYRSFDDSL